MSTKATRAMIGATAVFYDSDGTVATKKIPEDFGLSVQDWLLLTELQAISKIDSVASQLTGLKAGSGVEFIYS